MGPRFKVSSERPKKRGIDLATPGLVVQRVIHYITAAPKSIGKFRCVFFFSTEKWSIKHGRYCIVATAQMKFASEARPS